MIKNTRDAGSSTTVTNKPLVNNQNINPSFTSPAFQVNDMQTFSMHAIWTGTSPVGTMNIVGSNDGVNFDTGTPLATGAMAGNSANKLFNVTGAGYRFAAFNFVYTSGTGNVTVLAFAKD